ncbi:hypothetical protein PLICRDRAFT_142242 [Plicaturopsis crispa FD-325 SS-3]|nr:hypothetical protein PLICRDRAFT_142242 [Plicaturopsis crispa FD-325 SS-3]
MSSENTDTVYLISGANRGIGLGLATHLASRPSTIIFAGARTPASASSLHALSAAHPGKVHIVKLVSGDEAGNKAVAEEIAGRVGRVDVVIANAGLGRHYGRVHETPVQEIREHHEVNVIGTVVLFTAMHALLEASKAPKFVAITTISGSVESGTALPIGLTAYGASKAAENWIARKIHFENERFVSFAVHPGSVGTDMRESPPAASRLLHGAFEAVGFDWPALTVEESVAGIVKLIDSATREETGGTFLAHDGEKIAW